MDEARAMIPPIAETVVDACAHAPGDGVDPIDELPLWAQFPWLIDEMSVDDLEEKPQRPMKKAKVAAGGGMGARGVGMDVDDDPEVAADNFLDLLYSHRKEWHAPEGGGAS